MGWLVPRRQIVWARHLALSQEARAICLSAKCGMRKALAGPRRQIRLSRGVPRRGVARRPGRRQMCRGVAGGMQLALSQALPRQRRRPRRHRRHPGMSTHGGGQIPPMTFEVAGWHPPFSFLFTSFAQVFC